MIKTLKNPFLLYPIQALIFNKKKLPRSNLDVFHMREYGFIIIKPTKAENLSINKLEIGSWSLRNTCLQTISQPNWPTLQNMAAWTILGSPRPTPANLGRVWRPRVPFLAGTQNYKVVVPSVSFPEHPESHQSEFGRVRYAQNATAARNSQKSFFCSFSSESVPNYN